MAAVEIGLAITLWNGGGVLEANLQTRFRLRHLCFEYRFNTTSNQRILKIAAPSFFMQDVQQEPSGTIQEN